MGTKSRENIYTWSLKWTHKIQKIRFHYFEQVWFSQWLSTFLHTILQIPKKDEFEEIPTRVKRTSTKKNCCYYLETFRKSNSTIHIDQTLILYLLFCVPLQLREIHHFLGGFQTKPKTLFL